MSRHLSSSIVKVSSKASVNQGVTERDVYCLQYRHQGYRKVDQAFMRLSQNAPTLSAIKLMPNRTHSQMPVLN